MKPPRGITLLVLDFETLYDSKEKYSLKNKDLSTTEYVRDKRFKVWGASILTNRMKAPRWLKGAALKRRLAQFDWSKVWMVAHNCYFDGLILKENYGHVPARYIDTVSIARALFRDKLEIRNDLNTVADVLGIGHKHKTYLDAMDGNYKPTHAELRLLGEGANDDVQLTAGIFHCMMDEHEFPPAELDLIHHTVKCYADPVLKVNKAVARRVHEEEVARRKDLIKRVSGIVKITSELKKALGYSQKDNPSDHDVTMKALRSRKRFPELLRECGVEPPRKVSPTWMKMSRTQRDEKPDKKYTYAFAKTDLQFLELQGYPDKRVQDLVAAKLLANSNIQATRALRLIHHADPALPIWLNMYAAHTLRWGGGDKMNPQNLSKDGELRKAIIPPPGHVLVVVDSKQIEARMNAWLAGQMNMVEQFREYDLGNMEADPYCRMADKIFGRHITKADDLERFVGKTCVLGMGFQMAHRKYQLQLESGALGKRVVLDSEMYPKIVRAYRDANPHIVNQWWFFDECIGGMMHPNFIREYRGCIEFNHECVWLPNDLALHYPRLRHARPEDLTQEEEDRKERFPNLANYIFGQQSRIYGGKLTENIVQALARQVVAEQIMLIADLYRVVLLVHDEVVLCVKKNKAKQALADTIEAFGQARSWCPDLPVGGEGKIVHHYQKI